MTRYFTAAILVAAGVLVSLPAGADGAADKVTGKYWHAACAECPVYGKNVLAHEASAQKPQKGWIYILRPDGRWNYVDLSNAANACVRVFEDGKARIGGMNIDGTGPGLGLFVGWELEDNGEPAAWVDRTVTVRFPTGQEGLSYFLNWCETGSRDGNTAVFPHDVIGGNLQIHNHRGDGD